jgi:hypothetical protein
MAVLLVLVAGLSSCASCKKANAAPEAGTRSEAAQGCDQQAAHPEDSARWAKGVADAEIAPGLAVSQCMSAVNEFPKVARFHFQLGRAFLAGDHKDEAQKAFQTAANLGYCPAKYYLGEIIRGQALGSGDAEKANLAGQLFREAKECGFGPAVTRLEELVFQADDYANPKVMEALWEGKIDELNDARLVVALFCRGIQDYVSMEFHPASQDCPGKLAQPAIAYNLEKAAAGDPRADHPWERPIYDMVLNVAGAFGKWLDPVWQGDPEKYKKYFISLGTRDATLLIKKHGCLGSVTQQLYGQVVIFARASRPLVEYKDTLLPKAKELFGEELNPAPDPTPSQ